MQSNKEITATSLVSIVMPCYNCGKYVEDSVNSVLGQSYLNFELLLIDDASDDFDTKLILESLNKKDERVKLIINSENYGISKSRNIAINMARGDLIAFLDSDDIWTERSLEDRCDMFEKYPHINWLGGDHRMLYDSGDISEKGFYEKGEITSAILQPAFSNKNELILNDTLECFLTVIMAWTGTVMVKRELLHKAGGFNEKMQRAEDNELWLRLASMSDFMFIPKVLAYYRQHAASVTNQADVPSVWNIVLYNLLLHDKRFKGYKKTIRKRLASFYKQQYYHYKVSKKPALIYLSLFKYLWHSLMCAGSRTNRNAHLLENLNDGG